MDRCLTPPCWLLVQPNVSDAYKPLSIALQKRMITPKFPDNGPAVGDYTLSTLKLANYLGSLSFLFLHLKVYYPAPLTASCENHIVGALTFMATVSENRPGGGEFVGLERDGLIRDTRDIQRILGIATFFQSDAPALTRRALRRRYSVIPK